MDGRFVARSAHYFTCSFVRYNSSSLCCLSFLYPTNYYLLPTMAFLHSFPFVLAVFAVFTPVTTAQQCYGLDGIALDSTYTPCNLGAKHSSCCATKRTNGSPDICLSNGLCMSTQREEIGMIWQTGCTDKTSQDTTCSQVCSSNTSGMTKRSTPVTAWQIQTCNYGTYCCRAAGDRRSCCDNASVPKITTNSIGTLGLQANTTTATDFNITEAVQLNAPSMRAPLEDDAPPILNSCEKERRKLAVVSGIIGGILGTALLVSVGVTYWMYTRERRQRRLKQHYEKQFSQTNAYRKALASTVSLVGNRSMEDLHHEINGLYASVTTAATRSN